MTIFKVFSKDILSLLFENLSYEDYCKFRCISKYIYSLSENISYYMDVEIYNMRFISKRLKPLKSFENLPNLYFNKTMILINDLYFQNIYFENNTYFENSLKYIESFIFEPFQSIWTTDYYYDSVKNYKRDINLLCINDNFKLKDEIQNQNQNQTQTQNDSISISNSNSNSNSKKYRQPRSSKITLDENTIIQKILCYSKKLSRFEIKDNLHIIQYDIYKDFKKNNILCYLPNTLKVLNLSGIVNMSDNMLNIVTSKSKQLIKLDISRSHITNEGLRYLKRLNDLKTCNLSFTRINDESFEIIGELPNLRKINLSMCRLITNIGIGTLVQKNPHLTHLSMEFTNVGQMAVIYMTNNLKNPIYINLNYTHYAEFLDVSKIKEKCKVVTYKRI